MNLHVGGPNMSFTLDALRVESLISFVDRHVRGNGCDHTHRATKEWALRECGVISAQDFARKVAESGDEELAAFTFREAGFVH
jgi:hypothetical protein